MELDRFRSKRHRTAQATIKAHGGGVVAKYLENGTGGLVGALPGIMWEWAGRASASTGQSEQVERSI